MTSQKKTKKIEPIVKNAVRCTICQSPADRYEQMFICQKNSAHVADLWIGIFSDLTDKKEEFIKIHITLHDDVER